MDMGKVLRLLNNKGENTLREENFSKEEIIAELIAILNSIRLKLSYAKLH